MSLADELRDADIQCEDLSDFYGLNGTHESSLVGRREAEDALAALARLAIGYKAEVKAWEQAAADGMGEIPGRVRHTDLAGILRDHYEELAYQTDEVLCARDRMKRLVRMWREKRDGLKAERDLAHDHILQLETELAYWRGDKQPDGPAGYWYARALTAEAERDRARDLAVGLEQECAKLDAMLKLAVMTWTAGCDQDVIDVPQFVHVTDAMEWLRAMLRAAGGESDG